MATLLYFRSGSGRVERRRDGPAGREYRATFWSPHVRIGWFGSAREARLWLRSIAAGYASRDAGRA